MQKTRNNSVMRASHICQTAMSPFLHNTETWRSTFNHVGVSIWAFRKYPHRHLFTLVQGTT